MRNKAKIYLKATSNKNWQGKLSKIVIQILLYIKKVLAHVQLGSEYCHN